MPESSLAEIYFISIMMVLIIVICTVATYFFFRQYNREKKWKEQAKQRKLDEKLKTESAEAEQVKG